MEDYQGLNSDLYVQTPNTTATYITLNKSYAPNAVAIITNCNSEPVFVTALTSASGVSFPSSASSPAQGKVVPPATMVSFPIPDDTTVFGLIEETVGTGKVFISVQSGGRV
jgi:hypothetical protein